FLGLPFSPDGNRPSALLMDAEAVRGLTDSEIGDLFRHRGILLDAPAWEVARERGVDALLAEVPLPAGLTQATCFHSPQGGRTAVIPSFDADLPNAKRLNLLHIADWVSFHRLPVIMETPAQAVVVPRIAE